MREKLQTYRAECINLAVVPIRCAEAHTDIWRPQLQPSTLRAMKPLRPLAFLRRKSGVESALGATLVETAGASAGTLESAAAGTVENARQSTLERAKPVSIERAGAITAKAVAPNVMAGGRTLPRPALRWVGQAGRIALRPFDFAADADAVCAFQEETYSINFPDFRYTDSFAQAFRHDLRRAALDANHAVFVLDDGVVCGFLWLVICENNWTRERYGYVNNLYIAPTRRGQGLARELMTQSDSWFRSRRIRRVRLTVTTSNEEAVHLYENCGYSVTRWEMEKEL